MITCISVQAQDSGEFTVPFSDPAKRGKIKVHINSGSVTVKGTSRKDILVKYSSMEDKETGTAEIKDGMRRVAGSTIDLKVTENENLAKVESGTWNKRIMLDIEVPSGIDMLIHTYNNGDVSVRNVQGELELTNFNGAITAENISGSIVANTYNGEIKVVFDKVTTETPMSFSTFNGDVDITFPSSLKASLKMKTDQGEIYSGFEMKLQKSAPIQKKESKSDTYQVVVDEWMRGEVNGGGPEISMKNYNGNIYIRKK